jgi:hypothetical protein
VRQPVRHRLSTSPPFTVSCADTSVESQPTAVIE